MTDEHTREATEQEERLVRMRFGTDWQRVEHTLRRAGQVQRSRESGARRYVQLVEVADEFSAAVAPYAACRGKGCSHCCHMAVNIGEREAQRIGEYLGREPTRLPVEDDPYKILAALEFDIERYTAQACPMLAADGSCTVYPVRPLACRLAHSLEADPELCNLATGRHWVRKLNTSMVSGAFMVMDLNRSIGDIREYFPDDEERR